MGLRDGGPTADAIRASIQIGTRIGVPLFAALSIGCGMRPDPCGNNPPSWYFAILPPRATDMSACC